MRIPLINSDKFIDELWNHLIKLRKKKFTEIIFHVSWSYFMKFIVSFVKNMFVILSLMSINILHIPLFEG